MCCVPGSGEDTTKSEASGAYQVMPKVITGRKSHTDESVSSLYKGRGESRLLLLEITRDFPCVFARRTHNSFTTGQGIIRSASMKFRRRQHDDDDARNHGDRDHSGGVRVGSVVAGGFVLGVLQIPQQGLGEMLTLRVEEHSVSKSTVCSSHGTFFLGYA